MKVKRLLSSGLFLAVILTASIGIMPVGAEGGSAGIYQIIMKQALLQAQQEKSKRVDGDLTTVWQSNRNGKYYVCHIRCLTRRGNVF